MSLEFIARRERVETTEYFREFDRLDCPGAGFSFPSNAAGLVDLAGLQAPARVSWDKCQDGTYPVRDAGVRIERHSYWNPAVVRCECGRRIYLDDAMTNECERCGLLCNGSGQVLAPVAQWSDEDRYAVYGPQNVGEDY